VPALTVVRWRSGQGPHDGAGVGAPALVAAGDPGKDARWVPGHAGTRIVPCAVAGSGSSGVLAPARDGVTWLGAKGGG